MVAVSTLLKLKNRRLRKGKVRGVGLSTGREEEASYRRHLFDLMDAVRATVERELFPLLLRLESQYRKPFGDALTQDGYAMELNRTIERLASQATQIGPLAKSIAEDWAQGMNSRQRRRFYKSIEKTVGVNLNGVIREAGIEDVLEAKIEENVALIKSLPEEYYKQIRVQVNGMTARRNPAKDILKELESIGIKSKKRAKLIARDQTQKLNSAITQLRQEALGIESYEWQTSDDERVRDSHKRNNGKTFKWSEPPAETGHPGEDINCRCVALPIIDVED